MIYNCNANFTIIKATKMKTTNLINKIYFSKFKIIYI